jgi:hypothetical protein
MTSSIIIIIIIIGHCHHYTLAIIIIIRYTLAIIISYVGHYWPLSSLYVIRSIHDHPSKSLFRYDISQHYMYEKSRGVHLLSMMARAFQGGLHFAPLSPSLLLQACMNSCAVASATVSAASPTRAALLMDQQTEQLVASQLEAEPGKQGVEQQRVEFQVKEAGQQLLQQAGLSTLRFTRHLPPSFFLGTRSVCVCVCVCVCVEHPVFHAPPAAIVLF